jgi:hypothetical protein
VHELGRQKKQFVRELVAFLHFIEDSPILLLVQFDADDRVQLLLGFGVPVREVPDEPT